MYIFHISHYTTRRYVCVYMNTIRAWMYYVLNKFDCERDLTQFTIYVTINVDTSVS